MKPQRLLQALLVPLVTAAMTIPAMPVRAASGGTVLTGDVSGDGRVDNGDLILLTRASRSANFTAIVPTAADIDRDGDIDRTDLSLLRDYVCHRKDAAASGVGRQVSTAPPLKLVRQPDGLLYVPEAQGRTSLEAAVTGGSGKYTYEWRTDGASAPVRHSSALPSDAWTANQNGTYCCVITDGYGNQVTTGDIRVILYAPTSFTLQPQADYRVTDGVPAEIAIACSEGPGELTCRLERLSADTGKWQKTGGDTVQPRETVTFSVSAAGTYRAVITDTDGTVLTSHSFRVTRTDTLTLVTDPQEQTYLTTDGATPVSPEEFSAFFKPWKGLRLSVLGDSVSTYPGWIPEGNACYYRTSGSSRVIPSVNSMWWKQLCDRTGAQPLTVEAWSGSCLAAYDSAANTGNEGAAPGIADSRCLHLHDGDTEPDIICVALGCNDYYYNVPLGTWDGHTPLDTDDVTTWRGAYANLLLKIHERYPEALVFCLSPWFCVRGSIGSSAPIGAVNVNENGSTYQDYENAMQEICQLMQAEYVDTNHMGFTRYNYSLYFADDLHDATGAVTHPNAKGQEIIGQSLDASMRTRAAGYIRWLRARKGLV